MPLTCPSGTKFPRHTEIPVLFFATLSQLIFNMRNLKDVYEASLEEIAEVKSILEKEKK